MSSALHRYLLRHGDDNLILSQRLSEYISCAPELEEDLAVANVALDHLGVAMHLFEYASKVANDGSTADDLAFLRSERDFTNLLLVEQPNNDFAHIMNRQLLFDIYQTELWRGLATSADPTLAGIAAKAEKEATYHLRHSAGWVIRLGDGTEESHERAQAAVDAHWRYIDEMFEPDDLDATMMADGIGIDLTSLRPSWNTKLTDTLQQATLTPSVDTYQRTGGRRGMHTESLGHLLGEMQWMQRSYPGQQW